LSKNISQSSEEVSTPASRNLLQKMAATHGEGTEYSAVLQFKVGASLVIDV
jgi:hypothetical protein